MNAPIPAFSPQCHTSLGMHQTSSPGPAVSHSAVDSPSEYERWGGYSAELASFDNHFLAPPLVLSGSGEYTNLLDASYVTGQSMRDLSRDHNLPTGVGWGMHYGGECIDPGITEPDLHCLSAVLRDVDDGKFVWDGDIRKTQEAEKRRNIATHGEPAVISAGTANRWRRGNDVNRLPNLALGFDEAFDSVEEEVTSSHAEQASANATIKKRLRRPPGACNRKPSKARAQRFTAAPGSTSNESQASKRVAMHLNTPKTPVKPPTPGHSGGQVDLCWVRDIPGMVSGFVDQAQEAGRGLPYVDLDVGLVTETGIEEERAPTKRKPAWFHDAIRASIEENSNCETGGGKDVAASAATIGENDNRAVAQINELRDARARSRRKWICSICNKECQLKSRLQRHIYVHLKHVKFICSCGESFGRKDSMGIHRKRTGCVDIAGLGT